jgi:phosphatidylserine/phosphatidylglycerophosphate/cardiolipin synthase-like enzyme
MRISVIAVGVVAALGAVVAAPGGSASAVGHAVVRATGDPTPYLDKIEKAVKKASPGLEHQVWERSEHNKLDDSAGDWLLQTPECWGINPCPESDRVGTKRLLDKITANIGAATSSVDITTLGCPYLPLSPCDSYPDGVFRDAIVNGLRQAARTHHQITFRMLVGAPALQTSGNPGSWTSDLRNDVGGQYDITYQVGVMTTSYAGTPLVPAGDYTPSWNHSKLIVVDGQTVITGGVNTYTNNYVKTPKPVTDMMMAIRGPAAASATKYINRLWKYSCANENKVGQPLARTGAWISRFGGDLRCNDDLRPPAAASAGDLDMLMVGGLGAGIKTKDYDSDYKLPILSHADDAKCDQKHADKDLVNLDRDYQTINPEEIALREMVASATSSIVFSQQDLYGWCGTIKGPLKAFQPLGDLRLLDNLADRMIHGVKVRIVISTPGNEDSYSTMSNMQQLTDLLRKRIALQKGGSDDAAETVMNDTLQYASLRSSDQAAWKGKERDSGGSEVDCDQTTTPCTYAQHTKLITVDDRVFYLGSKNAYPAFLQDDGYFVEDQAAVSHIKQVFLDPQWQYSKATATYDWATHLGPPVVTQLYTERSPYHGLMMVKARATTSLGGPYRVTFGNRVECPHVQSGELCKLVESTSLIGQKINFVDETTQRMLQRVVPRIGD